MSYVTHTRWDSPYFTPASQVLARWGANRVIRGIVIHHWGDPANHPTFMGTVNYLLNNAPQSSCHAVVEAGKVAWLVNAVDMAFHAGVYANTRTIGLEANPRASKGDKETLAELIADIRAVHGNLTLYPHKWFMSTACPGRYDLVELDNMANAIFKRKYSKNLGPEIWL